VVKAMERISLDRSLWKPVLFMGCERVPFLIVAVTSGLLIMEGSLWVKIAGVIYFVIMVAVIAFLNANEPSLFTILWRYLWQYQNFYPSNALYPVNQISQIIFKVFADV